MKARNITPEESKLKVLGDFLLCERFDEITDFFIFKKCLGYLFKKDEQWFQNVFDYLVGTFKDTRKKRKYLSFTRLYDAYLRKNDNENISLFFDELMELIKIPNDENKITIGEGGNNEFFSNIFSKGELFFISRLVVLKKGDGTIAGLNLYYNNNKEYKIEMHNEKGLNKAFDLKLQNLLDDNINIYYKDIEIIDSITHIFGTFDETITSIGFKCSSGKMRYFGEQKGKPFLFGCFGKKVQCLNININEEGICKLETYFIKNKNINKHIEYKEEDINKIFFDENILEKNDKNYDLLRKTRIINFGKINENQFLGENINYDSPFAYLNNYSNNQGTMIRRKNPNYSLNPNPFLDFDNNNIIMPNPFFTKKLEEKKNQFKGSQIILGIRNRVKLNESASSILKLKKPSKSESNNEKKIEDITERLIKQYEKVKNYINDSLIILCPDQKKIIDIKITMNKMLEGKVNTNNNKEMEEENDKRKIDNNKLDDILDDGIKDIINNLDLNDDLKEEIIKKSNKKFDGISNKNKENIDNSVINKFQEKIDEIIEEKEEKPNEIIDNNKNENKNNSAFENKEGELNKKMR